MIAMGLAGVALLGAAPIDPDLADGLLHAAPLLALLGLLVAGRCPGAETIARLAARAEPRRSVAAPPSLPLRAGSRAPARGGALLGRALAVRPPPAALLAPR
jgi:hypothetical protein